MMRFTTQGLLDIGLKEENIWISHERKCAAESANADTVKLMTPMCAWTDLSFHLPKAANSWIRKGNV